MIIEWIKKWLTKISIKNKTQDDQPTVQDRPPRVELKPIEGLYFIMQTPLVSPKIKIANISTNGVGFFKESIQNWPKAGEFITGVFFIQENKHQIDLKVIHTNNKIVGCQFIGDFTNLEMHIEEYLEIELTALKLTSISTKKLDKKGDEMPIWLYGPKNCELYLLHDSKQITHFALTVFGVYYEWFEGEKIKKGYIIDEAQQSLETFTQLKSIPPVNIKNTKSLDVKTINKAIHFVKNISNLEQTFIDQICKTLVYDKEDIL